MQTKGSTPSSRNASRNGAIAKGIMSAERGATADRWPQGTRGAIRYRLIKMNRQHLTTRRRSLLFQAVVAFVVTLSFAGGDLITLAQKRAGQRVRRNTPLTSHSVDVLSPEAREMLELASTAICKERTLDPKGSVPIDDMQGRPSLPMQSPEAIAGAKRAQRLLPIARSLVVSALERLAREYGFRSRRSLQQAIARVEAVRNIKPDMGSRDNASVFLKTPHTIVFGTIFLAGLPSDEGIISVLAHELVHIADGSQDSLHLLFRAVGNRASKLTASKIHDQRAEELTCDLVGTLASRSYISSAPSYEPLPRRLARSLEHNCVDQDEGDDDHLSPRKTILALLALSPELARALVYSR
jgi:hypothetical protein